MTDSDDKAIRVISFSSEQADWSYWEEKFLARAKRKGYKGVLLGTVAIPKDADTIDESTTAGKESKKAKDMNELAYEELILSIDTTNSQGKVAFQLVKSCKTTDYANEDSKLAWKRLKDKYAPKVAPKKMELKSEFQRSCLKNVGDDLDEWITNLEGIRSKLKDMGSDISDEDFLIHVLNNLPSEYEVQVSKLEDKLGSAMNALTIEDVRNELNLKYARMKRTSDDGGESEKALSMINHFKGKCTHCGKQGHKGSECWHANGKKEDDDI